MELIENWNLCIFINRPKLKPSLNTYLLIWLYDYKNCGVLVSQANLGGSEVQWKVQRFQIHFLAHACLKKVNLVYAVYPALYIISMSSVLLV